MDIANFITIFYSRVKNSPLFPYDKSRPASRGAHMREVALPKNIVQLSPTQWYFELGNDVAESTRPYYHILEDAEVIHYGNRRARRNVNGTIKTYGKPKAWGTTKSKGTQAGVNPASDRDYGMWLTGTTKGGKDKLYQEYRQSRRSKINSAYSNEAERLKYAQTNTTGYFPNIHYQYIERIIDSEVVLFAGVINAKYLGSKTDTIFEKTLLGAIK